jgi:hypothetical protein
MMAEPATSQRSPRKAASPRVAPQSSASAQAAPLPRRRCVLVAKQLTNSDASSGRIILPRVAGAW